MQQTPVEILLVEDSPYDAELTLSTLRKNNLANHVEHVSDGEQALEFIFARGQYAYRSVEDGPKVIDYARPEAAQGRWAGGAAQLEGG